MKCNYSNTKDVESMQLSVRFPYIVVLGLGFYYVHAVYSICIRDVFDNKRPYSCYCLCSTT